MKLETKIYAALTIIYIVGIVGLSLPQTQSLFISLSTVNIALAIGVLLYFHFKQTVTTTNSRLFIIKAIGIAVAGFLLEVAGVKTGAIFGNYAYGAALGIKLLDVPLLIGLNWFFMVYCSVQLARLFKRSLVPTALLAGLFMTAYDIVLEPNAIAFNYWQWANNSIPLQNYIAWFGFGSLFCLLFSYKSTIPKNPMAVFLYAIQLAFFASLILLRG